ncbi:hypothetical protein IFR04_009179 [Cadophora malorum]|uniref:Uncharacterized protein n=1 Tax=Cadophora malorum TaxID=108018 RepID=A0A8H7TDW8_9HELO|nr:hypothetical protein IFR04_009179 [Cadophora malorum]
MPQSMSTLKKQTSRSRKACQGNDPWTKIVDAAHDLRIIRNLSNAHIRRVAVATEVLQQEQNSPKRQKYQLFLYNVLRKCGPHAVLVCAIALSQRLVFEMKNNDRKTLVNILEKNKGNTIINDSTLRSLASRHKIPSSVEDLQAIIQRSDQNCIRQSSPAISTSCTNTVSLNDTQSGSIATSESPLNTPSCARLEQHLVLEKAPPQGLGDVFDDYICDAIRRDTVQSDGMTSLKAAVTMDFPPRGLVDSLMSLAIHPSKVGYLAIALFGVRVESAGEVRFVSLEGGVRLTPNPEITLKGVLDEAIIDVFGSEIHRAITACRMRRKELEEGNRVTECVSMILTSRSDEGAIINLSLGVEEGTQIREKLYT